MVQLVFWVTLASAILAIAGVLLSWGGPPAVRIWPPPRGGSWQAALSWIFTAITLTGPLLLGVLDWNAWSVPGWLRAFAGLAAVAGVGVGLAAMRRLTVAASFGLQGELVTSGPYRYSRNPQVIAFSVAYLGFALLCGSLLGLVVALLVSVELGLSPFAEEPWLRERLGPAYEAYASRVPRFLGVPRQP